MTIRRLIQVALGSIRRNAGRSLLTMLGVVIGVGSVVVMVAIGQGAEAEITAKIQALGTNLVVVTPGTDKKTGVSGGAGSMDSLTLDDVKKVQKEALNAELSSPVIQTFSMAVNGGANWRTLIMGVDVPWFTIRSWPVANGRAFDDTDVRGNRKVVILGATVAEALYGDDDPVGRTLRLRGIPLEIVGVLPKKGLTPDGNDQDDMVVVPYTTVRSRMAGRQFIAQILVSARSETAVPETISELRAILRESHGLGRNGEDDFTIRDQRAIAETASETTDVMRTLLMVVASVSLVVGGIGIMNIMLVSVTERTREIGIRRALGARRRDVLAQFLVEAVVLSSLGGFIGAALGVGVTEAVGAWTGWPTAVTASSIAVAMAFSAAVGIFFGWWPARRAAALDPIEALRFQ
jgi:putative ABC transport system permease protein